MKNKVLKFDSGIKELEIERAGDGTVFIGISEAGDGYTTGTVTLGFEIGPGQAKDLINYLSAYVEPEEPANVDP